MACRHPSCACNRRRSLQEVRLLRSLNFDGLSTFRFYYDNDTDSPWHHPTYSGRRQRSPAALKNCLAELGVLSPWRRVLDNRIPRFFRRLAEGVFDDGDVSPCFPTRGLFERRGADTGHRSSNREWGRGLVSEHFVLLGVPEIMPARVPKQNPRLHA